MDIDEFMKTVTYKYHWCNNTICGCLGCVNKQGNLLANGFSKAEWQAWVARNPELDIDKPQSFIDSRLTNHKETT
jgi:hypothetical protein